VTGPLEPTAGYTLEVDGREHRVEGAWLGESLLYVLRERLGRTAAKDACAAGECGACSVLVDGTLVSACLVLAAELDGCRVTTAAGLAGTGALTDVQRAFVATGAVQCGFCTPGLVVAVQDLLERVQDPDADEIREGLAGNLCRCTGYGRIVAAVQAVVAARTEDGP